MTDDQNNRGMNPVAAGIVGLILGVAGVAAVALSDQETRNKAARKAARMKKTLQQWSNETIKSFQGTAEEVKKELNDDMSDMKEKQEEMMEEKDRDKVTRSIH